MEKTQFSSIRILTVIIGQPAPSRLACLLLTMLCLPLVACQTIDATGERHLSLIGERQEIEMGETSNEDIITTMGLYEDESLQNYVQELGSRIAATTERPELPWTFQVVDDEVVNAFALPGGYIYLTRGILSHFENQAQLVGVLGHEIAHVTAKHSVIRLSKAMVTQLGLGVATIAVPELQEFSSMLGQGMKLLFLKFSRDDETEADRLGVRYMQNVNEDPKELMNVMAMLGRISDTGKEGALPQWAATHPHPENRMDFIAGQIAGLEHRDFKPVERESYLQRLDGMVYGPNPREGIVREAMFYHPDLAFQLQFPAGWEVVNRRGAVLGLSPGKDAAFQLTFGSEKDPVGALQSFFGQTGINGLSSSTAPINGLPAASGEFRARTNRGEVQGLATFIRHGGHLYQLFGYSPLRAWSQYDREIRDSTNSFERLTDNRYLDIEPLRLKIITADSAISLKELHARHKAAIPLEELAQLNQLGADEILQPGRSVKMVTGELP